MDKANHVQAALRAVADPVKAKFFPRFFKTGPGEYGEGDTFVGVTVPAQRKIAKQFKTLPLTELQKLLHSPIHEERLTALLILVGQYSKTTVAEQKKLYLFYLKNMKFINNWDLVDSSAPYI